MVRLLQRLRSDESVGIVIVVALGLTGLGLLASLRTSIVEEYEPWTNRLTVWLMRQDAVSGARTLAPPKSLSILRSSIRSLQNVEGFTAWDGVVGSGDTAEVVVKGASVTPGLLGVAEARITYGRPLAAEESRRADVVLLSESLASRLFGTPTAALNQTVRLNRTNTAVIGVVNSVSSALELDGPVDVISPADYDADQPMMIVATLAENASRQQAQAELNALLSPDRPDAGSNRWVVLTQREMVETRVVHLLSLGLIAGAVIVIVMCSTLAYLLTAREHRLRLSIAVRWALGATRRSLMWWRMSAAATFVGVGAILAIVLSAWALRLLSGLLPRELSFLNDMSLNVMALLGSAAMLVLVIAIFSWQATTRREDGYLFDLRTEKGVGSAPLRTLTASLHVSLLVATSVAFSVATYLIAGSLLSLSRANLGIEVEGLNVAMLRLPEWKYKSHEQRAALLRPLLQALATSRGVESVSLASSAPPSTGVFPSTVVIGRESPPVATLSNIGMVFVGDGYFETVRQNVLAGRVFQDEDFAAGSISIVVSASTASLFGGAVRAIGREISLGKEWRRIVGVVADVRSPGLLDALKGLHVYLPLSTYRNSAALVFRGDDAASATVRATVEVMDADVRLERATATERLREAAAGIRFLTLLFGLFTILTCALVAFGVHAVVQSFAARQRSSIALRLAVGGTQSTVVGWILRRALYPTVAGAIVGVVASYPLSQLFQAQLFSVEANDPIARLVASIFVLGVSVAAILVPAWKACRVSPAEILKGG